MRGIELSEQYYETYGKPMLEKEFPQLLDLVARGLTGSGSECFGFDDEVSRDHDFEPGFCIFLPGEDVPEDRIERSKRIGIDYAGEAKDYLWRFTVKGDPYVSR